MKRPEKINPYELLDIPDSATSYRLIIVSDDNFAYLVEKHNELVDIINELMDFIGT